MSDAVNLWNKIASIPFLHSAPTSRVFRDYNVNQPMLFGPDAREWLSDTHPSHFISNIVEKLDLTEIYKSYEKYVDEKAGRKKERKKEDDFWMEENGENLERRLPSIQTENQYLKLFQPVVIRRITTPE